MMSSSDAIAGLLPALTPYTNGRAPDRQPAWDSPDEDATRRRRSAPANGHHRERVRGRGEPHLLPADRRAEPRTAGGAERRHLRHRNDAAGAQPAGTGEPRDARQPAPV